MVRIMTIEDYEGVYALWKKIKGFGIRSIDDSKEGVARFLQTKPDDKCRGRKRRSHCRKYFVRSRRKTGVFVSCLCR